MRVLGRRTQVPVPWLNWVNKMNGLVSTDSGRRVVSELAADSVACRVEGWAALVFCQRQAITEEFVVVVTLSRVGQHELIEVPYSRTHCP